MKNYFWLVLWVEVRGSNTRRRFPQVSLYSHDLRWLQNITGDQLGSYFGYCLAVVDFNGDSLDDIIVGAPMYTDFADREMKIEVGKVHVLIQNNDVSISVFILEFITVCVCVCVYVWCFSHYCSVYLFHFKNINIFTSYLFIMTAPYPTTDIKTPGFNHFLILIIFSTTLLKTASLYKCPTYSVL